ncbi:oligosaccharide flippase family protein [Anaerolineales bacterium HSG24]|nr:oligosaccharide flippase family protein [Anaerolineales bacterium HSG24]
MQPKKSSFAGDVLKLVTGTTFAQVIAILAAPILTRLYDPEAFGVTALFVSITTIIGIIACMRYELAIMLPERDEEAANILAISIGFVLLISTLTSLIIWFGQQSLLNWLNVPELRPYLWLIPIMISANGIFFALSSWNSRTKRFGRLSITQIIQSFATTGGKVGAGLAGHTTGGGLIGSTVLGMITATLTLGGQTWHDDSHLLRQHITWRDMLIGVKRYRKFPLYHTWAGLFNTISWQLPNFFLVAFFSTTTVGYYALGSRMVRLPMSLIGGSIAKVFFQRASVAKNEGTLAIVVENVFQQLVKIGMFPSIILTFIGQDIFIFIFGESWAEAGVFVQILAPWTFFLFIASPMGTLFSVLERQEFSLYINIALFTSRLFVLALGGYLGNARFMLVLFGISGVLVYGSLNLIIITMVGIPLRKILYSLLFNFTLCIPAGIILMGLHLWNAHVWIVLSVACILTGIYFGFLIKTDPQIRKLVSQKLFSR